MDVKKVALLVGALVIAVVTAFMAKNMFAGAGAAEAQAAPAVPMGPKVVVARRGLAVGTMIDAEALAYQPWPQELVQGAYYTEGAPDGDLTKLIGTVVRSPIAAGQPVTRGSLVGPDDRGFLAAALGPGMRAVTVPIGNTEGVAGFVFPGDRVDMVLTQAVGGSDTARPLQVSETILRNLRVLATDQRIDSVGPDGKMHPQPFSSVTLEVTPRIAEKIAVAKTVGTLSLALRSIADNSGELERAVASGDIKLPAGATPADEKKLMLAVANRPVDGSTTYSTAGDVSRFQRRTVPAAAPAPAPAGGPGAAPVAPPAPVIPTVRIARGNNVSIVPVGAR